MSILNHLKQVFDWNKYYYFFTCGITFLAGILYYSGIGEFDVLLAPVLFISLVTTFLSFQRDHFSIKYLQSLPISKKELFHLKLRDTLLSLVPLLFWAMVFPGLVMEVISDSSVVSPLDYLNLLGFYLVAGALISIWSFYRLYEASRSPYVKTNSFTASKTFMIYFTSGIYGVYFLILLGILLKANAPKFLQELFGVLSFFKNEWTFLVLAIGLAVFEYRRVFRRWMEEQRSYVKNTWKPLRDVPLMALMFVAVITPPYLVFKIGSQTEYGKSNLIELVVQGKQDEVEELLNKGADINAVSSLGYTALMTAAQLGNEKMYFYLLSKGASKEGKVAKDARRFGEMDIGWLAIIGGNHEIVKDVIDSHKVNQPMKDFYPLHIASTLCHEQVIDYLLELGADPRVKNKRGRTPLHKASEKNCLNGAISLIEAGAELSHRDENGKLALDYVKWNKDLRYYLERKSRSPAGK